MEVLIWNRPFETKVEKQFRNVLTDAQATLFRDDSAKEFILSFRGTSSLFDIITDLRMTLVDCTPAVGASCKNCTVGSPYSLVFHVKHLGTFHLSQELS